MYKLINRQELPAVDFNSLGAGDFFIYNDHLCMKLSHTYSTYNTFNFMTKDLMKFDKIDVVRGCVTVEIAYRGPNV